LAGRLLSVDQYRQAIRKPWGVMPAFTEQQISDQDIANLNAYFTSLPRVPQPGPYRTPLPDRASARQQLAIAGVGCAQCHGATMNIPRSNAGAIGADFNWFQKLVYEHTTTIPEHWNLLGEPVVTARMGNYSKTRLPESVLREIWAWVSDDLGFRVPVTAQLSAGVSAGNRTTYTLTLANGGLVGKGLTAEDLTIALTLAPGVTVASTTGVGYQGLRADAQAKVDTAVWQVPRLAPKDKQAFTITLSPPAGGKESVSGGTVRWSKPAWKDGTIDTINIAAPPPPPQTR
jgi:mono/diheme cytochrome c family protein